MLDFRKIIDRLQQLVSEGIITEDVAKKIYPDFVVESEDERIRKDIIAFIKAIACKTAISGERECEWIAYLERQKEQKSKIDACGFPLRDEGESACSYLERCLSPDMRNIWYEACSEIKEKQKEQKPILFNEPYNPDDYEVVIEGNATSLKRKEQKPNISDEAIREGVSHFGITQYQIDNWLKKHINVVEQKPAKWSEEDEKVWMDIKCDLIHGSFLPFDKIEWLEIQLKSLRPQSKAEPTLLNENIIEAAVAFVEQNDHFSYWRGIDKNTVIKALRSLKPYWKPSEEQMEALKEASASWMNARMGNAKLLKSLYEQLKKLI